MKTDESLSKMMIKRIVFIALILVLLLGVGVFAGTQTVNSVTIKFSDKTELTVITAQANVGEILRENNIYILDGETVTPNYNENIGSDKVITISREKKIIATNENIQEVAQNEEIIETSAILESNSGTIVEKIIKETVEIPFETITKEVSSGNGEKVNKVVQEGQNGIKEITYKVKYKNDIEIDRTQISEVIIKEPVNKVVQVTVQVSSRAGAAARIQGSSSASAAEAQAYAQQRCASYGWSDEDFYNLVLLWNKESHWNMYAQNRSSGAYGIPQALPASKMASAGSDYLTNYQTQVNWGLNYIRQRYGNPSAAYAHSQVKGWY